MAGLQFMTATLGVGVVALTGVLGVALFAWIPGRSRSLSAVPPIETLRHASLPSGINVVTFTVVLFAGLALDCRRDPLRPIWVGQVVVTGLGDIDLAGSMTGEGERANQVEMVNVPPAVNT